MSRLRLLLASASPRRLELLRQLELEPLVAPANLDERELPGESPWELVRRLAEAKGRLVADRATTSVPLLILAADTAVALDGRALGKPADRAEAEAMLRALRGREHEVLTGVFLLRTDDGRSVAGVESTRVAFRSYDEATLLDYAACGEPLDKAGGYAIQERGARLVSHIAGSWSNVVGLPLERLPEWLRRLGVELGDLRG